MIRLNGGRLCGSELTGINNQSKDKRATRKAATTLLTAAVVNWQCDVWANMPQVNSQEETLKKRELTVWVDGTPLTLQLVSTGLIASGLHGTEGTWLEPQLVL